MRPVINWCIEDDRCTNGEILRVLLKKCPEASKVTDNAAPHPLHNVVHTIVADGYKNFELIKVLMDYFPEAALVREDHNNNLPIHMAFYYCYDKEKFIERINTLSL